MSHKNTTTMRFSHIEDSNKLVALIEHEVNKLRNRHPQVHGCDVVVETLSHRHRKGNMVQARVTLELPGRVFVTAKRTVDPGEIESASAAVYKAFETSKRAAATHLSRRHRAWHNRPQLDECLATG